MGIDWSIDTFDSLNSTQDLAKEMGRMNEPEGKVVHAFQQKKGTGRHGRPWISDYGNLYLSLLLRPNCKAKQVTEFSLLTAIAAADTIERYMQEPQKLTLKWPNDILIEGKKCAGILLETELSQSGAVKWLAIGFGLNVNKAPPDMGVGIQDYSEQILDLITLRNRFLENMARMYAIWDTQNFDVIRRKWLEKAHKKGTPMEIRLGVQIERGYFHDLDPSGNLVLRDGDYRTKTISAGEVHFLDKESF